MTYKQDLKAIISRLKMRLQDDLSDRLKRVISHQIEVLTRELERREKWERYP